MPKSFGVRNDASASSKPCSGGSCPLISSGLSATGLHSSRGRPGRLVRGGVTGSPLVTLRGVIAELRDLVGLHCLTSGPGRRKCLFAQSPLRAGDRLLVDPLLVGVVKPYSQLLTERRRGSEESRAALFLVLGDEDRHEAVDIAYD